MIAGKRIIFSLLFLFIRVVFRQEIRHYNIEEGVIMNKTLISKIAAAHPPLKQPRSEAEKEAFANLMYEKIVKWIHASGDEDIFFCFKEGIADAINNKLLDRVLSREKGNLLFLKKIVRDVSDFSFDGKEKADVLSRILAHINRKLGFH
jgi:hypothetical protein